MASSAIGFFSQRTKGSLVLISFKADRTQSRDFFYQKHSAAHIFVFKFKNSQAGTQLRQDLRGQFLTPSH